MVQILTPDQIIAEYSYTVWIKNTSTRIKVIQEADRQRETSFLDSEGRTHEVKIGRCICVGPQGERWTCSVESLERDRYPVSTEDSEGYRQYRMKHPQPVRCFDIPFSFILQRDNGNWQCDDIDGGIVTWNGKTGEGLDMRVVMRSAFAVTYEQTTEEV